MLKPKANKIFTDRVEPKAKIDRLIEAFKLNSFTKKILCFYGIGGIGKTRFLREVRYLERTEQSIQFVAISLDTYELDSPVKILISIRKQLQDIDLVLFDYTLAQYYKKNGLSFRDLSDIFESTKSSVSNIMKGVVETAGDFIPYYGLIKHVLKNIKDINKYISLKKYEPIFEEIDALEISELYGILPKMLADAINDENKQIICYLDDYDSLRTKTKDRNISDNYESWLMTLYQSLNNIFLVIASREKLKWAVRYPQIAGEIEQYYMSRLSDKDSSDFLHSIPIENPPLIAQIVSVCNGLPLCLDMCVDIYMASDNKTETLFNDLSLQCIIERYLRHLNESERSLTLYLSYLYSYEIDFVKFLAREVSISIPDNLLTEYLEKTLFIDVEHYKKMDSTIKAHIFEQNLNHDTKGICKILKEYLIKLHVINNKDYLHYFKQLVFIYGKNQVEIDQSDIEFLTYGISRFADRGYVAQIEEVIYQAKLNNSKLESVYIYFLLIKYRKQGKILEAMKLLNEVEKYENPSIYGKQRFSYQLVKIMVRHLSGDYDRAQKSYETLLEDHMILGTLHEDKRTYTIAYIKYCDLLFLKGQFTVALNKANQLSLADIVESENKMELLRVKGHIYRFNFQLEKAENIYQYILNNESADDIRIQGNIYNNLAETYQLSNPELCIFYASKSIEINTLIQSQIELGKTKTALVYAYSKLGDFDTANTYFKQSMEIQSSSGYQSGILFSLVAFVYLSFKMGKSHSEIHHVLLEIQGLINRLNVYRFLQVFINQMYPLDDVMCDADFLDYTQMIENIHNLL